MLTVDYFGQKFFVAPIYDSETGMLTTYSDIAGLNIETACVDEFYEIANDVVFELIKANHKA